MGKMITNCALFILLSFLKLGFSDLIVEVESGKVKGYQRTTITNVTYYAYQGIPYAQPPVGELRFEAPKPALDWEGVLDVKKNSKFCYQVSSNEEGEDEDCLYLNVFTPVKPNENASLPVLVTIYGGAFKNGRASSTNPRVFMERDIVVVSLNYRVGVFGFLSTNDVTIPGNNGLKDQNLALQWVQRNIHLFGGDPAKVTLNGQSAGSASVAFHYLSPKSAGLFRAGVGESGVPLCNFAYARTANATAYNLAKSLNELITNETSSSDLLTFLRSVAARDLDAAAADLKEWAPVVEPEHEGAFVTEPFYEAIQQGHINKAPLILGFNSEEAIVQKGENLDSFKKEMARYDGDVRKLVNVDMHITDNANLTGVGTAIRLMYTTGDLQDDLGAAIRYFSDNQYTRSITKYAKLQSQFTDVYFYVFSYHGTLGGNDVEVEGAEKVAHGEEKAYLWLNDKLNLEDYPEPDGVTSERFVTMLTNFVKTVNPTPEQEEITQNITWPKVTTENFYYLDIDTDLSVQTNPKSFTFSNWELIYDYYAIRPFDTY